eukprot:TRINITY_DN5400_c0_g1_i3.p1 TRINITY_DN5400_c0_g1~~TRINITY_DN5400_c0_g1_i3.p1  ORF type:complete len:1259 (-),score=257.85 TRINITY_DN5400_c0_g1_i3:635-4294(-)
MAIQNIMVIFFLLFGGYHLKGVLGRRPFPMHFTIVFLIELGICIFLALSPLSFTTFELISGTSVRIYHIVSSVGLFITWIFCFVYTYSNYMRSNKHDWRVKLWWIGNFLASSLRLQLQLRNDGISTEFLIDIIECVLALCLCIIAICTTRPETTYAGVNEDEEETLSFWDTLDRSPEETTNIFTHMTFGYLNPLLKLGYKKPLTEKDLFPLPEYDTGSNQSELFSGKWNEELFSKKSSLLRALAKTYVVPFAFAGFLKLCHDILVFAGPVLLQKLLAFISNPNEPGWHGILYAFLLMVASIVQSLFLHGYFFRTYRVGQNIRSSLIMQIYEKAFNLSFSAKKQFSVGEIVNLQSLDTSRICFQTIPYLHLLWSAPFQLIVSLVMLWKVVGVSTLGGLAVMILMMPFNIVIGKKVAGYQKKMMTSKDKRNKLVNEVLSGIRVIKFFAWEESFAQKIMDIRDDEVSNLKTSKYLRAFLSFCWGVSPVLVSLVTFAMYTLLGNNLNPEIAFTSIALFNIIRFPINALPMVINGLIESKVSLDRLHLYLTSDELDPNSIDSSLSTLSKYSIDIKDASFSWDDTFELSNLSMKVKQGDLIAVIGSVGSGKSSLLSSIIGDMPKIDGQVKVSGSLAYAPQQAWMKNATLEENIRFGLPMDRRRYEETIDCCELIPDFNMLPAGDETEIGENGINLSGGQKQRVSIARCVYQDADIYLFDDPLSAVDAHVGKALFDNCIKKTLKDKTRILITHQLNILPGVDYIYVMNNGQIEEQGTYKELMDAGLDFASLMNTHVEVNESSEDSTEKVEKKKETVKKNGKDGKTMTEEDKDIGDVKIGIYKSYIKSIGGAPICILIISFFVFDYLSKIGSNYWLALWSDAGINGTATNTTITGDFASHGTYYFLGIYSAISAAQAVFVFSRALSVAYAGVNGAKKIHNSMIKRVIRAPTSFFDTTPLGRILNRFTKDLYVIDEQIIGTLESSIRTLFSVISVIVVIAGVTPFFLTILVPLSFIYHYVQQYYLRSSRELKRLDSVSRSPIYSLFSETLTGISTIRAFGKDRDFKEENETRLNNNQAAFFLSTLANRWLGLRLEFVGTFVVFAAAFFAVIERGTIDAGLVGLSITYALNLTSQLNWLVRMSTEVETQLVAVERTESYATMTTEAPAVVHPRPAADWPSEGRIEFDKFQLRYREGLPLVIKNISCTILPRENIGVVGRTGAGKSSLMT